MQQPTHGPIRRALNWVLVPLYYPEYRRLAMRSFVLSLRLELLCTLLALVSPFATPGLLRLLFRWFEQLRWDVAELGRMVRSQRAPLPRRLGQGEFQNPWT